MNTNFKDLLAETKFVVEATSNETQTFWSQYSDEAMHRHLLQEWRALQTEIVKENNPKLVALSKIAE